MAYALHVSSLEFKCDSGCVVMNDIATEITMLRTENDKCVPVFVGVVWVCMCFVQYKQ